jgi:hypothetical protein
MAQQIENDLIFEFDENEPILITKSTDGSKEFTIHIGNKRNIYFKAVKSAGVKQIIHEISLEPNGTNNTILDMSNIRNR